MVFDFLYLVATLNSPDLIVFVYQCFSQVKEFQNLFNAHTALQIHMTSDWVPMYSNVFKSAHFCETKAGPKEVFFGDEVVNECWKSGSKKS